MTTFLEALSVKLGAGGSLTEAEGRRLAASRDLAGLGRLAAEASRRRHGRRVTFGRVADIPVGRSNGLLDLPRGAGELRIVGAPGSLAEAVAAVRAVRAVAGTTPVSGFSLADLGQLAERTRQPLVAVMVALKDAGLDLVAEAPLDRLPDPGRSLAAAVQAGLLVSRVTLHESAGRDGVAIYRRLAGLQEVLGSLTAFAPLPRRAPAARQAAAGDLARRVALARLLVHNIDTIQVDWTRHGPKAAARALRFGADDLDSVSPVDRTPAGRPRWPLAEVRRNIRAASLVPVERNGRFERAGS